MIEPIRVCELEAGRPNHQVPRFQKIAAINRAKTIAKPAPLPTFRISSTGSSEMIPKATAPLEASTPMKLHMPDQTTAMIGWQRMGVDDGRDRVGGVMKTVDELKAERDQQGDAEQQVRQECFGRHRGEIADQVVAGIDRADEDDPKDAVKRRPLGLRGHLDMA